MRVALLALCLVFLFTLSGDRPTGIEELDPPRTKGDPAWMEMLRDPATGTIPVGIRKREVDRTVSLPSWKSFAQKGASLSRSWASRGPTNVGGRTRALGIDRTDERMLLAGGAGGGLWRSQDGGVSWTRTTDANNSFSVTALVQDPRDGRETDWYFSTGEGRGSSAGIFGGGIFKSSDRGASWTGLTTTSLGEGTAHLESFSEIWNLAATADGDTLRLFAATWDGIFLSVDEGASWSRSLGGREGIAHWSATRDRKSFNITDVVASPSGWVYASDSQVGSLDGFSGVYATRDGRTWTNITPPFYPGQGTSRAVLHGSSVGGQELLLVNAVFRRLNAQDTTPIHQIWRYEAESALANGVWRDLSTSITPLGNSFAQLEYDQTIALSPADTSIAYIGGVSLWRSDESLRSTPVRAIGPHADQHVVRFFPSDERSFLLGNDGGVYRGYDNGSEIAWTSLESGYVTSQFFSVAVSGMAGDETLYAGTQDNGALVRIAHGASTAEELFGGDGNATDISADGEHIYTTTTALGFGLSRFPVSNPTTPTAVGPGTSFSSGIAKFVLDPNDPGVMYAYAIDTPQGTGIFRHLSLDEVPDGNSIGLEDGWEFLAATENRCAQCVLEVGTNWFGLEITDEAPRDRLYLASAEGVFRLDDARSESPELRRITGNLPLISRFDRKGYVRAIAANPSDGDEVLVGLINYGVRSVWHSTNGGLDWVDVSGNLEESPDGTGDGPAILDLEMLLTDQGPLYLAGTTSGLFSTMSLEGGRTVWVREAADLVGTAAVFDVETRQADGFVAVATHGFGLFSGYIQSTQVSGPAPMIQTPLDAATNLLPEVQANWEPVRDAATYEIQISSDAAFVSPQAFETFATSVWFRDLAPGGLYYWRLRGVVGGTPTSWSATRSFEVMGQGLGQVSLSAPFGAVPLDVTVRWSNPGTDGIDLEVFLQGESAPERRILDIDADTVVVRGLDPSTSYTLRGRARSSTLVGPWSNSVSLTTVAYSESGQPELDDDTLLLLNFNQSLAGEGGEYPERRLNLGYVPGVRGYGLEFNGSSLLQYARQGNLSLSEGTAEMWLSHAGSGQTETVFLAQSSVGPNTLLQVRLIVQPGGNMFVEGVAAGDSFTESVAELVDWPAGEFHHVAFTWSQEGLNLYIDGRIADSNPDGSAAGADQAPFSYFYFGGDHFRREDYFNGTVDEVRISSRPRTASEIGLAAGAPLNIENPCDPVGSMGDLDEIAADSETTLLHHFDDTLLNERGTLCGSVIGNPTFSSGLRDQAITLNDGSWLILDDASVVQPSRGTIEVHVRPSRLEGTHTILDASDLGRSNAIRLSLKTIPNGRTWIRGSHGRTEFNHEVFGWSRNEWHHVAFAWDESSATLYADGSFTTSAFQPTSFVPATLVLGNTIREDEQYVGSIDELRISSEVRRTFMGVGLGLANCVDEGALGGPEDLPGTAETALLLHFNGTSKSALSGTCPVLLTDVAAVPDGARNGGAALNGQTSLLAYPVPSLSFGTGTIELFVRPDRLQGNQTLAEWDNLSIQLNTYGTSSLLIVRVQGAEVVYDATTWPLGQWRHLALSWTGTAATLYVRGEAVGTAGTSGVFAPTRSLFLGSTWAARYRFQGAIDELRVSTVALEEFNARGPNTNPAALAESYTTAEDTPLTVAAGEGVLANDTDEEGDALSAELVAPATSGEVVLQSDGSLTYTPAADFNGSDGFTYRAFDGELASDTIAVAIEVTPVNDPPVAPGVSSPMPGEVISLEGPPSSPISAVWDEGSDIDGDQLLYGWRLVVAASGESLAAISTGSQRTASVTTGELAEVLSGLGVTLGQAVEVEHYVVVSDGSLEVSGPRSAATLLRGSVTSSDAPAELPTENSLERNYPNPFASETTVRVGVASADGVVLSIYDLLGRRVYNIPERMLPPGWHDVVLRLDHLPSGTYIQVLSIGDFVQSRAMTIAR